jgi:hypothetical protein
MIRQGREENARDDGRLPLQSRREQKGQELRLVAHFREGDD